MKSIVIALTLVCSSAFAQELDATEALARVLPVGQYSGTSPEGVACSVSVKQTESALSVSASMDHVTISRKVKTGSSYRWNLGTRNFLSLDKTFSSDGVSSVEEVLRTLAVEINTQYVVVARVIVNDRDVREDKVECVINL
jgi:hypothetical protein